MKKVLVMILAVALCFGAFAGCKSSVQEEPSATPTQQASEQVSAEPTVTDTEKTDLQKLADGYPDHPVQIVIPYPPGGGSDILTRAIMQYAQFPETFVAINIEGASGMIGALQAYHSTNDGYTILAHNAMDVASYSLNGTSDVELWSEMEHICDVVADYNVISTNKQSGWTSIEQVVEYAKAHPGEIKWGCTGSRNVNYATTMLVVEELGLTGLVTIVPYDNGPASKTALMGNHIQMETNSCADIRSSIESGDTIPLMVCNDTEVAALPDVPSTLEKGVNVTFAKPRGYYAPKGTSQEQLDLIAATFELVCKNEDFQKKIAELGLEVKFVNGKDAKERVSAWVADLKPVFVEMG